MIDKKKIRIMTALAVYDKHWGPKDRKVDGYYRTDYVYKKNCWTRICVFAGLFVIFGFYCLSLFFVKEPDLASLDYMLIAKQWAILAVLVLVFYTALGTILSLREYERANRRLKNYHKLLDKLNAINENKITK